MSCKVSDSKDIGSGFRSQPDRICDFQIFPHLVLKLYFTLDQSLMDICTKPSPRFPGGSVIKNLPPNAGDIAETMQSSIPGPGRSNMLLSN